MDSYNSTTCSHVSDWSTHMDSYNSTTCAHVMTIMSVTGVRTYGHGYNSIMCAHVLYLLYQYATVDNELVITI